jgi:glutamyl-tRNA synthetase
MNPDGSKLSKRQGDIQVQSYRDKGIFPTALLNFVTKAGGGFIGSSLDDVIPLKELVSHVRTQFSPLSTTGIR